MKYSVSWANVSTLVTSVLIAMLKIRMLGQNVSLIGGYRYYKSYLTYLLYLYICTCIEDKLQKSKTGPGIVENPGA